MNQDCAVFTVLAVLFAGFAGASAAVHEMPQALFAAFLCVASAGFAIYGWREE